MILRAPFPYFGGKRKVAHLVWERFGDVPNYVEPFAGSLAVLLGRPNEPRCETVNDIDCFVSNFWRALTGDPDQVAAACDWPVNEADMHARNLWLVNQVEFRERMKTDPEYCDAKIAGWWAWGISQWIGGGWCSGVPTKSGRQRPSMTVNGVHSKPPRLDRGGTGVDCRNPKRQMPDLHGDSGAYGRGVHAKGLTDRNGLLPWLMALSDRLRRVRVCCGDWKRILGPSPTVHIGTTAVFLDPPYTKEAGRDEQIYANDDLTVGHDVRAWAIEHGDDPRLRIALCGYEGEYVIPDSWSTVAWKAQGGYAAAGNGRAKENCQRERIWFSPHCLKPAVKQLGRQESLFGEVS